MAKENPQVSWIELLAFIRDKVPSGQLTTYKNLSKVFFGGRNSAPAITSMLKAAVRDSPGENRVWTNRVVNAQGICMVEGQMEQLKSEGISFIGNSRVNFHLHKPVDWVKDYSRDIDSDDGITNPPDGPVGSIKAYDYFRDIFDRMDFKFPEEMLKFTQTIFYEPSSFANQVRVRLGEKLGDYFNNQNCDLFSLINRASESGILKDDAVDLAHFIRKQRNQIIYNRVSKETYDLRNRLVLISACLLWPQLPR
jgi:alkylated DNA nucleotide flippase Atl1